MKMIVFYLPCIWDKEDTDLDEEESCMDPILLAKAEKCIEIAKNFDIDPDDDNLIEECAKSLMFCPDNYIDRIEEIFKK
jgi:hypothetical protein